MTNWPNIQEYRNLDAKFIDERNFDSAADSDLETVIKIDNNDRGKADEVNKSKTVRCVIKKDFEEAFKKLDRENGLVGHELPRSRPQETVAADRSHADHVRLQNHLKWKKQKEEEYLQKKEAERLAQQKKREEEARLERARKEKEKEKEEKIREWQEQKAREKEERKKEKMVMKMLEKELKVTPSVDKEKLIEEWVKLKNKQKQMETEKKAELLKKEEENRALRQNQAELSYRQWKERVKGRMMTLPKNGYQIFGPKPVPVVKEDWNHDFINGSPRNPSNILRGTKSNTSTSLTFRTAMREVDTFSKDMFYLGDVKSRSPSFYHLNRTKSGLNLCENGEAPPKGEIGMPLKELQPGTIDLKKKGAKSVKGGFEEKIFREESKRSEMSFLGKLRSKHPEIYLNDLMCFQAQGDQNRSVGAKKSEFWDALIGSEILPSKKKIDLYINTCPASGEEVSVLEPQKKKSLKSNESRPQGRTRKDSVEKKIPNESAKSGCKQKCCALTRTRSLSLQKDVTKTEKIMKIATRKATGSESGKTSRRSRSYDKSPKKVSKSEQKMKNCSSSKSTVKISQPLDSESKSLKVAKGRSSIEVRRSQSRSRSRKAASPEKSDKKLSEQDHKTKNKPKKKNPLSKSLSFSDSPYYVKNPSKSLSKMKAVRRKSLKDVGTKSEEGDHSRKVLMSKT